MVVNNVEHEHFTRDLGAFSFSPANPKGPMFIPFLAAATVATAFAELGAMTIKISVLTKALQALSIAFIMVVIAAIAQFRQRQQKA